MFDKKVNIYNGVLISSLLVDLNDNKIKVDFISDFDKDILKDRLNLTKDTTNADVLKNTFNKYLDENKGGRSLEQYLDDIAKDGFFSPYYSGLNVEIVGMK